MLKFKLTKDKQYLKVYHNDLNTELQGLKRYFSKKSRDADFNILVERGLWDGKDHFLEEGNIIPVGLWKEIYNFSKKFDIDVHIDDINSILNLTLEKDEYVKFVDSLFKGVVNEHGAQIYPRDYQFEGAYRALRYGFCNEELATSAGKTLIFFTYNCYLKHVGVISKNSKTLIVVPNVGLVNQTAKAFEQYSNGLVKFNIHTIGGTNKFDETEFEESDMVISTYQSLIQLEPKCLDERLGNLIKKKVKTKDEDKKTRDIKSLKEKLKRFKAYDFFKNFSVVNIDEAHKSRGSSIGNIILACKNWKYKLGLSGTTKVSEEYSDFFMIQKRIGPLVMTLSAKYLMDKKYSPNVNIKMLYLEHNPENYHIKKYKELMGPKKDETKRMYKDMKKYGSDMLGIEKRIVYESIDRINFINGLVKKLGKNSLILFTNIKDEYGLSIQKKLNEWNEHTFYVDGGTSDDDREIYKNMMETNDDVIIVASYGTFSTGIDLKNVHHILFVESTKAEITIRQSIGRGMRKLAEKNKVTIWDLIDDLNGYSIRHSKVRESIYVEQSFDIKKHRFKIYS